MVTPRKPDETDEDYVGRLSTEADVAQFSADVSDVWRLERDDAERPEAYAMRALALGCGADYCRRIPRCALS